jgi:hypothetical protein
VPTNGAFNVGDADAHMVYTPRIGRTFGWVTLWHSPDYFFMNWSTLLASTTSTPKTFNLGIEMLPLVVGQCSRENFFPGEQIGDHWR